MSTMSIGTSALIAYQAAMSATSNNIANATTPGYSRQTAVFSAISSQKIGNSYLGSGVQLGSIFRNTDEFANAQVRNSSSVMNQYQTYFNNASQISQLLSQSGTSLNTSFQSFFTAVGTMNNTPSDGTARTVTLNQASLLAGSFNQLQAYVNQAQSDSNTQIGQTVTQVNTLTKNIAQINQQLVASPNVPELLDQQDQLLQQLSKYMDISTVRQSNGMVDVGLSNGNSLVVGSTQNNLTVKAETSGTIVSLGGADVSRNINSGSIKGLLDYQATLHTANQTLGQMAIGLAQSFNTQQGLGVDLNSQLGSNLFTDFNSAAIQQSRSVGASTNTGSAVLSVNISNISQTQISDYSLTVTDAASHQYSLVRQSDGTSIPLTWDPSSPTSPATLTVASTGSSSVDGLTITVNDIANFATKDSFTLAPTANSASQIAVTLSSPSGLALASPVRTQAASSNTGSGTIALGSVFNNSAVNNNYAITIDANDPTKYTISPDSTVYTLTPGSNNTIYLPPGSSQANASYSVSLSGAPAKGDVYNLGFNSSSPTDNGNGLLMASIQTQNMFFGGTLSLSGNYNALTASIGATTGDAQSRSASANILNQQAVALQSSTSGVNLDEEAANLLSFQNAYKAAAQIVKTANDIMDTLLIAVGAP